MLRQMSKATIGCFLTVAIWSFPSMAAQPSTTGMEALKWAHVGDFGPSSPAASATFVDLGVSCLLPPTKLSESQVREFLGNSGALLTTFPIGGLGLSNRVRSLVGSSSTTLKPVTALIPSANDVQRTAIGSGLARVVGACEVDQLDFATQIQNAAADIDDASFLTAFSGALGDEKVGAINSAAAPQGGSNGGAFSLAQGGQFGAANGFSVGGNQFVVEQGFSFSVGSAGTFTLSSVSPTTNGP